MLTSGIFFKNFKKNKKTNSSQVKKKLLLFLKEKNYILDSLKKIIKIAFQKK